MLGQRFTVRHGWLFLSFVIALLLTAPTLGCGAHSTVPKPKSPDTYKVRQHPPSDSTKRSTLTLWITCTYLNTSGRYDPTVDLLLGCTSFDDGQPDQVSPLNPGGSGTVNINVWKDCVTNPELFPDGCPVYVANLGAAKPGATCNGSGRAIGSWFGPADTHDHETKQIYEVHATNGSIDATVGWIYETFGAGSYFQPNLSVSGSVGVVGVSPGTPYVAIGSRRSSDISSALSAAESAMGLATSALPPPFNQILPTTTLGSGACFNPAWDGVYSA